MQKGGGAGGSPARHVVCTVLGFLYFFFCMLYLCLLVILTLEEQMGSRGQAGRDL